MNNAHIVLALSADHIVKLTGITMRQLAYWDKTGFFKPEYASDNRRSPHSRVYSFRDAVGLRTVSTLMNTYNVSRHHLKEVAGELAAYTSRPWSELRLRVLKGRVQFDEPETGRLRDAVGGQYAFVEIVDVIKHVEEGLAALKTRGDDEMGKFERHRYVAHNKLVVAGTRVPVETVLEFIDAGYSVPDIIKEFPALTEADIVAVKQNGSSAIAA